ncbi:MAG: hypothetical protein ACPGKO_00585 [Pseudohongiellaceae bacterium]
METKNYLMLCAAVVIATSMSILFVPGLSDSVETSMLSWLGNNARAERPY